MVLRFCSSHPGSEILHIMKRLYSLEGKSAFKTIDPDFFLKKISSHQKDLYKPTSQLKNNRYTYALLSSIERITPLLLKDGIARVLIAEKCSKEVTENVSNALSQEKLCLKLSEEGGLYIFNVSLANDHPFYLSLQKEQFQKACSFLKTTLKDTNCTHTKFLLPLSCERFVEDLIEDIQEELQIDLRSSFQTNKHQEKIGIYIIYTDLRKDDQQDEISYLDAYKEVPILT